MKVKINKSLYEVISEKYSSIEYLLEETLPAISYNNLKKLPACIKLDEEVVMVDITDDVMDQLREGMSQEVSVDIIVNYIIAIGFAMEV